MYKQIITDDQFKMKIEYGDKRLFFDHNWVLEYLVKVPFTKTEPKKKPAMEARFETAV